ncbi:MAG TPA: hypothetical protein VF097_04630 [Actinomycetota bacterium]
MAVCLRCEWEGPLPAPERCPSCGVPLFEAGMRPATRSRARTAQGGTAVLEAEVVERRSEPEGPPRPSPRRWALPLALVAVAAAIPLLPRQEAPRPARPGVANPPSQTLRFIGLPPGLSDRTVDRPVRIAFSATQPVPEDRAQLFQLWRLDLPTGELTPGPIVGDVLLMRYAPDDSGRLAFLVSGGGLFVLDGFLASRPTWVDGEVNAFDFAPGGTLVYAKVERRSAPGGGALAAVRLTAVEPGRTTPSTVRSRTIHRLNLRGYAVRGWELIGWGVRDGEEQAIAWNVRDGRVRRAPELRLTPRARSGAGSWELGARGVGRISRSFPRDPAHLAVSGGLAFWAGGDGLTVAERDGGRSFVVELPPRFPIPTGPVAATRGR